MCDRIGTIRNAVLAEQSITMRFTGVTALCQVTNNPDVYEVEVAYTPAAWLIDHESLLEWLSSDYPETAILAEDMCNEILHTVVEVADPKTVRVRLTQTTVSGIVTTVTQTAKTDTPRSDR